MKILSRNYLLAGFFCMMTCFFTHSYATETYATVNCNGTTQISCETISRFCSWINGAATSAGTSAGKCGKTIFGFPGDNGTNGACYGRSQADCGSPGTGKSNSFWCTWKAPSPGDQPSCITNAAATSPDTCPGAKSQTDCIAPSAANANKSGCVWFNNVCTANCNNLGAKDNCNSYTGCVFTSANSSGAPGYACRYKSTYNTTLLARYTVK